MKYLINTFKSDFLDCNCYVIKSDSKCLIIDPCVKLKVLKNNGINKVDAILITHCHIDHIICLQEIVHEYHCNIYLSKKGLENIFDNDINLSRLFNYQLCLDDVKNKFKEIENDEINIEDLKIKCIPTPGHTNCSVCYLIDNNLFTGDLLFDGSVGRTDFPTGSFDELIMSLKKIIHYDYIIYPGHGNLSRINIQKCENEYIKYMLEVENE